MLIKVGFINTSFHHDGATRSSLIRALEDVATPDKLAFNLGNWWGITRSIWTLAIDWNIPYSAYLAKEVAESSDAQYNAKNALSSYLARANSTMLFKRSNSMLANVIDANCELVRDSDIIICHQPVQREQRPPQGYSEALKLKKRIIYLEL